VFVYDVDDSYPNDFNLNRKKLRIVIMNEVDGVK